jgi:hypothetical protein
MMGGACGTPVPKHVALTGVQKNTHSVLMRKPEGNIPLGNPDVNKRIILKWISRNNFVMSGPD